MHTPRSTRSIIVRFFEPFRKNPRPGVNLFLYDATVGGLMVGLIYGSQYVVQAIEAGDSEKFKLWIGLMLVMVVLIFLASIFWKPTVFKIFSVYGQMLDEIYMPKVISGDNIVYEKTGTGRMIAIFGKGLYTWLDLHRTVFGDFASIFVVFISFFVSVYMKDVTMFWACVGVFFLVMCWFGGNKKIAYKRQQLRRKTKNEWVSIQRMQVKWFMSKQEILSQDRLNSELQKRAKHNTLREQHKRQEKFYQGITFDGSMLIAGSLFVGIVWYTGQKVFDGMFSYADMIVIVGLGTSFLSELKGLLRSIRVMIDKSIDLTKMRDLIDDLKSDVDVSAGDEIQLVDGAIDLERVSFSYDMTQGKNVFTDFSLSVVGGEKIALVGPSGGGKSTLVKLISGYLLPTDGTVSVDGQKLGDVSLKSYYAHVGYLSQEPSVFDGTIRENLEYGMQTPLSYEYLPPEEIIQGVNSLIGGEGPDSGLNHAIKNANCEFVYDLPQGLDTEIGERGIRLSGGQRQRLALAKIFLKNPKIIILDEPTSALDSESEEAITASMSRLFQGRTVIVIAHRLQTVKHADRILLIQDGEITEEGIHDVLMQKKGVYHKMVELQSGF